MARQASSPPAAARVQPGEEVRVHVNLHNAKAGLPGIVISDRRRYPTAQLKH